MILKIKKNVLSGAVQLAVFFLPAWFLNDLLSLVFNNIMINILIIPLYLGICSYAAVFSSSTKEAVYKWLLSFPVTIIFWMILVHIDFSIRGLNWVYPDYGEPSAANNFGSFIMLVSAAIMNLAGIITGICISGMKMTPKIKTKILLVARIVCTCTGAAITAAIIVLHFVMPRYNRVFG